jgi:Transposase and inactivated derivatives
LRESRKSKQDEEGLGRSCGGFSTKIHALCDALGLPLRFVITAGQRHDVSQAISIVSGVKAQNLLADKGYDCDELRAFVESCGCQAHIPPRKNRLEERTYDEHLYKERHKVECLFGFLKHYRRLFARFDKTKQNFTAFLHFIAALQWLK